MTFQAFLSLVAFSASVTFHTLTKFVSPSNIFSRCFTSITSEVTRCSSFFLFITWPKQVTWFLYILFMSNLFLSAAHKTVWFDLFSVHEIHSIFRGNHISVVTSFLCTCFEIAQALHPFIRMGSIYQSRNLLLVWIKVWLLVNYDFDLWKLFLIALLFT